MKIKQSDYNFLKNLMDQKFSGKYNTTWNHYKKQGLSPMRCRWDIYWLVFDNSMQTDQTRLRTFSNYLNDNHIDTALKSITDIRKEK